MKVTLGLEPSAQIHTNGNIQHLSSAETDPQPKGAYLLCKRLLCINHAQTTVQAILAETIGKVEDFRFPRFTDFLVGPHLVCFINVVLVAWDWHILPINTS